MASKNFSKKWKEKPSKIRRILGATPLKPKIGHALRRVELQTRNIEKHIDNYSQRDDYLFKQIVEAKQRHDDAKAKILSKELLEVRKQTDLLLKSKLSLRKVALKLRTVYEFGETISSITPIVTTLKDIRKGILGILPEVGKEIQDIETTLNTTVFNIGATINTTVDYLPESQEAKKILEEASLIAENRVKNQFPTPSRESYLRNAFPIEKDKRTQKNT
jgi:division protein CdvB (Snf7/Vps24/ESCRT-III family)